MSIPGLFRKPALASPNPHSLLGQVYVSWILFLEMSLFLFISIYYVIIHGLHIKDIALIWCLYVFHIR